MFTVDLPMAPSDNKIYVTLSNGVRKLSKEASQFQKKVSDIVSTAALRQSGLHFRQDVAYRIELAVFFTAIENKSWNPNETTKTKRRFKKVDAQNREKLTIDSFMGAIGVDDSHIMEKLVTKLCDPDNPRIEVRIMECAF